MRGMGQKFAKTTFLYNSKTDQVRLIPVHVPNWLITITVNKVDVYALQSLRYWLRFSGFLKKNTNYQVKTLVAPE